MIPDGQLTNVGPMELKRIKEIEEMTTGVTAGKIYVTAWLQVCRVGNNFAFHYSVDGVNFFMMRYFHLPAEPTIKVGLLAQAPVGNGGIRVYERCV